MASDPHRPRRKPEHESIEQAEGETSPDEAAEGETEHHGITGPRLAESSDAPIGPTGDEEDPVLREGE